MRVPYLLINVNYKAVYIDSALVGLVGTASMSNFPVVYGLSQGSILLTGTDLNFRYKRP